MLEWTLFVVGGFCCLLNFHLTFLRYPLHRLKGGTMDDFRWISGAPIIGSFLVAASLLVLHKVKCVLVFGLVLILIDTGGIHWFAGTMLINWLAGKRHKT